MENLDPKVIIIIVSGILIFIFKNMISEIAKKIVNSTSKGIANFYLRKKQERSWRKEIVNEIKMWEKSNDKKSYAYSCHENLLERLYNLLEGDSNHIKSIDRVKIKNILDATKKDIDYANSSGDIANLDTTNFLFNDLLRICEKLFIRLKEISFMNTF